MRKLASLCETGSHYVTPSHLELIHRTSWPQLSRDPPASAYPKACATLPSPVGITMYL